MKYYLCVKLFDNNMMHIIGQEELASPLYAEYQIVGSAKNSGDIGSAAAALVQQFCDTGAGLTADNFKKWALATAGERI